MGRRTTYGMPHITTVTELDRYWRDPRLEDAFRRYRDGDGVEYRPVVMGDVRSYVTDDGKRITPVLATSLGLWTWVGDRWVPLWKAHDFFYEWRRYGGPPDVVELTCLMVTCPRCGAGERVSCRTRAGDGCGPHIDRLVGWLVDAGVTFVEDDDRGRDDDEDDDGPVDRADDAGGSWDRPPTIAYRCRLCSRTEAEGHHPDCGDWVASGAEDLRALILRYACRTATLRQVEDDGAALFWYGKRMHRLRVDVEETDIPEDADLPDDLLSPGDRLGGLFPA